MYLFKEKYISIHLLYYLGINYLFYYNIDALETKLHLIPSIEISHLG